MAKPQPKQQQKPAVKPVISNEKQTLILTNRELQTIITGINALTEANTSLHNLSSFAFAVTAYQVDEAFKPASNLITKIRTETRNKIEAIRGKKTEDELMQDEAAMLELIAAEKDMNARTDAILDAPPLECQITKLKPSMFVTADGEAVNLDIKTSMLLYRVMDL